MPHTPTHTANQPQVGVLGQQFAPEFDSDRLLQLVAPQREAGRRRVESEIGSLVRTRGLSGAQEAQLFSQAEQADLNALAQAGLRAEEAEAQATQRERLIDEARQFTLEQEAKQRRRENEQAIERLLASVLQTGGQVAGAALGAPGISSIFESLIRGGTGLAPEEGSFELPALPISPDFGIDIPFAEEVDENRGFDLPSLAGLI